MSQERPPQPRESEQPSRVSPETLEALRIEREIFEHALKLERRLIEQLGGGDAKKGIDVWYGRGYRELFFSRIDHDPQFADDVLAEHLVPVLNRLEADVKARRDAEREAKAPEAERIKETLAQNLRRVGTKYGLYAVVGSVIGVGWAKLEENDSKASQEGPKEALLKMEELTALDPEITPERLHAVIATLPDGFVHGEVTSIGFRDEKYVIDKSYGEHLHEHSEGAATAGGGEGHAGTEIIFWRGMKDSSSEYIWNSTFLHEVGHANDWRKDRQLSDVERDILEAKVKARVQAPDRFRSSYVEEIENDDPKEELEIKAVEYWAEITEAYLSADSNLPAADAEIVKAHIARQDPNFDRDGALAARQTVLEEMAFEESSLEYQELPVSERASIDAWMAWRKNVEAEGGELYAQQEGRKALLDVIERAQKERDGGLSYALALVEYYHAREMLFEARLDNDDQGTWEALNRLAVAFEGVGETADEFRRADAMRREIDGILESHRVWLGGERHGMRLAEGELETWTEMQRRLWQVSNLNWFPSENIVVRYLETHSFLPLDEQPTLGVDFQDADEGPGYSEDE